MKTQSTELFLSRKPNWQSLKTFSYSQYLLSLFRKHKENIFVKDDIRVIPR